MVRVILINELTHFFTGYLIAAYFLKKRHDSFETFYVSMAALIPDLDSIINIFIPFEHGVLTHTLIGGTLFTLIYTGIIWIMGSRLFKEKNMRFLSLFGLAMIGMLSHLLLDSFTFFYSYQSDATHHMYLWPISTFPVHINTLFPGITYEIRVWVEVMYSIILAGIILIHGWIYKKENPFLMFNPNNWANSNSDKEKKPIIQIISLYTINLILIVFLILNYFI